MCSFRACRQGSGPHNVCEPHLASIPTCTPTRASALRSEARDPRFESLSGAYSEEGFKRRYAFLYDEKLPAEKAELKAALHKARGAPAGGRRAGGWVGASFPGPAFACPWQLSAAVLQLALRPPDMFNATMPGSAPPCPQVKNPAKRAELQGRLTKVEAQLRNEQARRRKEAFGKELKVGGARPGWGRQ